MIANAITALNEILMSEGQMAINAQITMYLLNRIREFNEWGQCVLLDLVSRYTPASQEEMFDIMVQRTLCECSPPIMPPPLLPSSYLSLSPFFGPSSFAAMRSA